MKLVHIQTKHPYWSLIKFKKQVTFNFKFSGLVIAKATMTGLSIQPPGLNLLHDLTPELDKP
jgi:hypothetical protein